MFVLGWKENVVEKDSFKFKAFADDKCKCKLKAKILFGMGRKHAGNGENAGYQHFLLFPQCFQNASFSGSLKVGIV